jgi:3'-phosphoadenosine 5'-phosphosulfate sulfotransferase (PAPS reductase)/FAD synthetase
VRDETLEMLRLYYRVAGRKREEAARRFVRAHIMHPCVVGVSWGKDSVVAAFLCLDSLTPADRLFHVSAGEYDLPGTQDVRDAFLARYPLPYAEYSAADYFEVARAYGLTDISTGDTPQTRAKKVDQFKVAAEGAAMRVWGLRADESAARRLYAKRHGGCAFSRRDGLYVLSPVLWWTWQDIWSVIVAHDLPYCPVYDKYDEIDGLAHGRSGTWAGTRGANYGRVALLKRFYPELFNRFASAFPEVRGAV